MILRLALIVDETRPLRNLVPGILSEWGFFTSLELLRHETSHCDLQMPADVLDN